MAKDIQWRFNPPYSSHRGGVWERQIRYVRRIFSAVSREQVLTDESLSTLPVDVGRILNNHPLYPVNDDPEQTYVLTPNHLLLLCAPVGISGETVNLHARYTRYCRQGQLLADNFWRRWIQEYLPDL